MKLIVAVVQSKDADSCVSALLSAGHECTRIASSGGFLDTGNVTILIGIADDGVDAAIALLDSKARRRSETLDALVAGADTIGAVIPPPLDVEVGGATVFVLDLDAFKKL